jgi:uncharacterized protein (DUF2236 family)
MRVPSPLAVADRVNPLRLMFDRAFDVTLRRRFFPGVQFSSPEGDQGWFGPSSPVWYVHEHAPVMALGLAAAATIETLHPDFAWMGYDHTRAIVRVDGVPTGEFDREGLLVRGGHSFAFFSAVAYGPTAAAERVTRAVSGMHHRVRGVRPDGRPYDADDPETLRWAYATVVWGIASAHERYHARPLRGDELDDYYRQFVRVGEALGGVDLPATKAEVADYLDAALPLMAVTPPAIDVLALTDPASNPLLLRPLFDLAQWAVLDLQPSWAQRLLRVPRRSRVETAARRAAVWSGLNAAHYGGGGPIREARQARARAGSEATADDRGAPPVTPVAQAA